MRYSRQELVIGKDCQAMLEESAVAIAGLGALGTVAAELLTRAGVGTITLIDRDLVELSNLQRQMLYDEDDIGKPKALCCWKKLRGINSDAELKQCIADINHRSISSILGNHDIILDCTDNLYTRLLINEFSRAKGIPWVYSAAIRDRGLVMGITPDTPCLRCVFSEVDKLARIETCDTVGVLNAITSAIASIQVNEAMKILSKRFDEQFLVSLNIDSLHLTKVRTESRKDCPVCNGKFEHLEGKKEQKVQHLCSNTYQFYFENLDIEELSGRLKKLGRVTEGDGYVFFENISAFRSGRVLVKAENHEQARSMISRYIGN